ncbi:MAG TPA: hypothetical protein VM389_13960, partial [Phycisphaerae bacterium]|nr:hypothetical protein [Phycisphaerae bacterium]
KQQGQQLSDLEESDHKQLTDKLRRIGSGKLHLDPAEAPQADTTAGGYTRPLSHLDDDSTAGDAEFERTYEW